MEHLDEKTAVTSPLRVELSQVLKTRNAEDLRACKSIPLQNKVWDQQIKR